MAPVSTTAQPHAFHVASKVSPLLDTSLPPAMKEVTDFSPETDLDAEDAAHKNDTWWTTISTGWFSHAGSQTDAWLTSCAAQVGQVMLTIPHAISLVGVRAAIPLMIIYTLISVWTIYLLNALYLEYKLAKIKSGVWFKEDGTTKRRSTQYFEVLGGVSKALGVFTLIITMCNLAGNAIAQLVAGAGNSYFINPVMSKRSWTFVWGALSLLMTLIPSFRDFRLLNVIAIAGTGFTAVYIWVTSISHGFSSHAASLGPTSLQTFFTGANVFLWAFGGHAVSFEIMDAQWKPSSYDRVYFASYLFTFTIAAPHSVLVQLAFPEKNLLQDNVYGVLPSNGWRTASIIIMLIHQIVAYALYSMPVFFAAEKLFGVHEKAMWLRVLARIPVALLFWFIALLLPFYGLLNSIIGALTGSMVSFILPALAYNWFYLSNPAKRVMTPKQPPRWTGGFSPVIVFNTAIVIFFTIFGFGIGGYAAIRTLVDKSRALGVFTDCYQCKA